jgi:pantoate--beta-alanine ligase
MDVIERIADLRAARASLVGIGLVPTMGFLHEGHLSLIRAARADNDTAVMSLFVNPAQFGPGEDFASYPRDTPRDLELAAGAGVDIVFMPSRDEVYPAGFATWLEVGSLTRRWEGEHRPGHFRGVATVVLKLFELVRPERAYFGEKDYQQLRVVTKMVSDLNVPVEVVPCPTVREPSGLALSSRNAYLSAARRQSASVVFRALVAGQHLAQAGRDDPEELISAMRKVLDEDPAVQLEYLAVVDELSLEPLERVRDGARVLIAVNYAGVRLIDNVRLPRKAPGHQRSRGG